MSQIITTDDLASYKNTTLVPVVAQQVVDAINTWVQTHTHRCWGEQKTITELYDWSRRIWLNQTDVVTTGVIVKLGYPGQTQTTLEPSGYWVNKYGRLTMLALFQSGNSPSNIYNDYMEITYTYGVLAVPDDLTLAVLGIAATFYNFAINGQQDVVAADVGSYHLKYAGSVRSSSGPGSSDPAKYTADANWQIIDGYRRQRL